MVRNGYSIEGRLFPMSGTIAILDDEPDRLDVMTPLLLGRFPHLSVVTFRLCTGHQSVAC